MMRINYEHNQSLFECYKNINSKVLDTLNPISLTHNLLECPVLVYPGYDITGVWEEIKLERLGPEIYHKYIFECERNTVVFLNDYRSFFADRYITLLKIITFSKWIDSYKSFPILPENKIFSQFEKWSDTKTIKPTTADEYGNKYEECAEQYIKGWLERHNIRFTQIEYDYEHYNPAHQFTKS